MPDIDAIRSSIGIVINFSISSAVEFSYTVEMVTFSKPIDGKSSLGNPNPI